MPGGYPINFRHFSGYALSAVLSGCPIVFKSISLAAISINQANFAQLQSLHDLPSVRRQAGFEFDLCVQYVLLTYRSPKRT
jgi:hypothetical protein